MEELRQMEQRTKELIIMLMALLTRDDIDYMYQKKKERRRLVSIENCVDASIKGIEERIELKELERATKD